MPIPIATAAPARDFLVTQVFISHAHKDADFTAGFLKPRLEKESITAWCSSADLEPGVDWERQVRQYLSAADWVIVVLSPNATCSEWVRAEVHWAVENIPGKILPALVQPCDPAALHARFATAQYIDFHADQDLAARSLIQFLKGGTSAAIGAPGQARATMAYAALRPLECHCLVNFRLAIDGGEPYDVTVDLAGECIIGRTIDAHLPIPSPRVSRRHARLSIRCDGRRRTLEVNDLQSTNGTYVNELEISSGHPVDQGDIIRVGDAVLSVASIDFGSCASSGPDGTRCQGPRTS